MSAILQRFADFRRMRFSKQVAGITCAALMLAAASMAWSRPVGDGLRERADSVELTEKRTRYSKTFDNGDGTRTWAASAASVHFVDGTGTWQDIETGIKPMSAGLYSYGMTRNAYQSFFSKDASAPIIAKFQTGNWAVTFGASGASAGQVRVNDNTITYLNAFPDSDIRFTTDIDLLRTEVILHKPAATNEWKFQVNLHGVRVEEGANGTLDFVDQKTGKRVWYMPKPFMFDADGTYSYDVTKAIEQRDGKTYFVIKADESWLNDPARMYPITVDPTWSNTTSAADTLIRSGTVGSGYNAQGLYIGCSGTASLATMRGLVQWSMSGAPAQSLVPDKTDSVRVQLYQYARYSGTTTASIGVYRVNADWTEANATWTSMSGQIGSQWTAVNCLQNGWYTFAWNGYSAGLPQANRGIFLKNNSSETSNTYYKRFTDLEGTGAAGNFPRLYIDYLVSPSALAPDQITSSSIRWRWGANGNDKQDGYKVYSASSGGTLLQTTTGTTWTESGLAGNTSYTRWVAAYAGNAQSARVQLGPATTSSDLPGQPGNASPSDIQQHQVTWNWTDNSTNETGFRVYDALTGGTPLQTLGAGVTTWTETGLNANTSYTRYVCAYNAAGESPRRQLTSAFTGFQATYHGTATTLNVPSDDGSVYEGWADGVPGAGTGLSLECGYADFAISQGDGLPKARRGVVKWAGVPASLLAVNAANSARVSLYCSDRFSATRIAPIGLYNLTSGNWTQSNATWNSIGAITGSRLANVDVTDVGDYTWQWNALTVSPVNGLAIINYNYEAPGADPNFGKYYAKNFSSKEDTSNPAPRLSVDYLLPDMGNPADKWITNLLLLGPVGVNDIDDQSYATEAGLSGDIEIYGNSTKAFAGKTWAAFSGNTSENGFNNYGWDLISPPHAFGTETNALFNLYVNSSTAADNCYIRLGSDDGVRLIVNDTIVGTDDLGRGWGLEQSVFGPFSLNEGWNRVLIKVRNGTGGFGLKAVRFTNADATNWTGSTLTFAVDDTQAPSNPSAAAETGGAQSGVWQNAVSSPAFSWSGAADSAASGQGASGLKGYLVYFGADPNGVPTDFQTASTLSPGAQSSGIYYLRTAARDKALNDASAVTLFAFAYDGVNPTNPTGAACSDGKAGGAWRNTVNPVFTLAEDASDAHSGLKTLGANARYRYYFGPDENGVPNVSTDSLQIAPGAVSDEAYYLRVQTQDNAGNWSDPVTVFTFLQDGTPPEITEITAVQDEADVLTEEEESDPVTVQGNVIISVEAEDLTSGLSEFEAVTVEVDGADVGEVTEDGGVFTCEAVIDPDTPNGAREITVTAFDKAGNSLVETRWIWVNKNQITGRLFLEGTETAERMTPLTRDVEFRIDGGEPFTVSLDVPVGSAAGNYRLVAIPEGASSVSAKTAVSLRTKVNVILDERGQSTDLDFTLLGGDLNNTNTININDYAVLKMHWLTSSPAADINGDGAVNVADYNIMKANWFMVGSEE